MNEYPGLRRRPVGNTFPNTNRAGGAFARNDRDDDNAVIGEGTFGTQQAQRQEGNPPLQRNIGFDRNGRLQGTGTTATPNNTRRVDGSGDHGGQNQTVKTSHVYVLLSAILAFLAIISPPGQNHTRRVAFSTNHAKTNYSVWNSQSSSSADSASTSTGGLTEMNFKGMDGKELWQQLPGNGGGVAHGDELPSSLHSSALMNGLQKDLQLMEQVARGAVVSSNGGIDMSSDIGSVEERNNPMSNLFGKKPRQEDTHSKSEGGSDINDRSKKKNHDGKLPVPLRWFVPQNKKKEDLEELQHSALEENTFVRILQKFIDPTIVLFIRSMMNDSNKISYGRSNGVAVATDIIDKILTSTPRLLAIANLLLAVTYLLHSAVADFFLNDPNSTAPNYHLGDVALGLGENPNPTNNPGIGGIGATTSNRMHRSGRERLGGYLLFKLLLVSAVIEPDTLDMLILLSWYTLLSFLRSLSYLAGLTVGHASASGQPPPRGVSRLLIVVLLCDIAAATICAALFHGAGWSMVILLTCDCALLAVDVLTHLSRYMQQILEERHQLQLSDLERAQLDLHTEMRRQGSDANLSREQERPEREDESFVDISYEEDISLDYAVDDEVQSPDWREMSRQLDRDMEVMESIHARRLAIVEYTAFLLELTSLLLTIGHFLHIWSLHGVTFNLVDGVLALHLHSAISATGKKIIERRNHNRIARDLDCYFENASEIEMRKASACGDVCCICLGTMSMGNVKKIGCGHLYHTNCLREVVERARSIDAARCPLCRASIVDGRHQVCIPVPNEENNGRAMFFAGFGNNNNQDARNTDNQDVQNRPVEEINSNNVVNQDAIVGGIIPNNNQNERALFRFSTEGILPAWLPVPAFSFEVVRRPPHGVDAAIPDVVQPQQQVPPPQQDARTEPTNQQQQRAVEQRREPSFWRRLLLVAGAIPMSPEEEATAIAQLVDMFPQFDRADLLRELRDRGSSEAVVEAVLTGLFTGVARGAVEATDIDSRPSSPVNID